MIKLIDILREEADDKEAAYADLLNATQKGTSLAKKNIYQKFIDYTYNYYQSELGELANIFPKDTKIENWKQYIGSKEQRGKGESVEAALVNYAKAKGASDAKQIGGKGHDLAIAGKEVEVKSSTNNTPQLILQTTYFKEDPNKFYAIALNSSSDTLTVNLISSDLLRKVSLGNLIEDELEDPKTVNRLRQAVEAGLSKIDLTSMIYNTLKTGREDKALKSFDLGNGVRVRFITTLSYEPGLQSKAERSAAKAANKK